MPFLGVQPTDTFASVAKQTITGDGSVTYTLTHSVAGANDLAVFVNNVRQEPTVAYSASGTSITFTEAIDSTDDCYVVYIARTFQSVTPDYPLENFSSKGIDDNATSTQITLTNAVTSVNNILKPASIKFDGSTGITWEETVSDVLYTRYGLSYGGTRLSFTYDGSTIGRFLSSGEFELYNDLTVDTDTLVVDSTNSRVGIGDSSPGVLLSVDNGSAEGTVAEFYGSTDGKTRPLSITSGTANSFSGAEWTLGIGSSGGEFVFENNAHSTPSELARIISSGQLNAYGFKATGTNNPYPIKVDSETFVYYPHYNTAHVAYYKRATHPSNSNEYHYYWRTSDTGASGGANETTWMTLNTGSTHGGKLYLAGGVSFASNFASANTLDDYEEGSWTPTITTSSSPNIIRALYTKTGRQVTASAYVTWTNNQNNNSSVFQIGGLPFTGTLTGNYEAASVGYVGGANMNDMLLIKHQNASHLYMHQNDGTTAVLPNSSIHSRGFAVIIFTLVYQLPN